MEEDQFTKDCKEFEQLIQRGRSLANKAPSIRGANLDDAPKSEQKCTAWFIETRNFLISIFEADDLDVEVFRKSFGRYKSMNLMGQYSGDWRFIKEDMHKGVGVLEGIYYSFKKKIKKRKEDLLKSLKESKDKIRVMFDNDILNKVVEGQIDIDKIIRSGKFEFYATHIQSDQVSRCPDEKKRAMLVLNLTKMSPIILPTESFIEGTSKLGEAKLGDGKIMEDLRKENQKHTEDALIGEVAIKKGILLVTNDKLLKSRVNTNAGRAINLDEFRGLT